MPRSGGAAAESAYLRKDFAAALKALEEAIAAVLDNVSIHYDAAAFRGAKRGPFVGTSTGGSTGQPLRFALPSGGSAQICSKRPTFFDGTEYVGVGIAPDLEVRTTAADFRAGRDAVRERAVRILHDGIDQAAKRMTDW